jgi:hypothetical protein
MSFAEARVAGECHDVDVARRAGDQPEGQKGGPADDHQVVGVSVQRQLLLDRREQSVSGPG